MRSLLARSGLRYDEHPAGRAGGGFAERQFDDLVDVGGILGHPVAAGETRVQIPMLDIAADFLGAEQAKPELRVVDGRPVGPLGSGDRETGLVEKVDRRLHQAAGGQAKCKDL